MIESGKIDDKNINSKQEKRIKITKVSYIYIIIFILGSLILDYLLQLV